MVSWPARRRGGWLGSLAAWQPSNQPGSQPERPPRTLPLLASTLVQPRALCSIIAIIIIIIIFIIIIIVVVVVKSLIATVMSSPHLRFSQHFPYDGLVHRDPRDRTRALNFALGGMA